MDIYDKDDNIFTIKLSFVRDFINDKIVFKDEDNVINNEYKITDKNIPMYIKNNFSCNENICSYIEDNIAFIYDIDNNIFYINDNSYKIDYLVDFKIMNIKNNNKDIITKDKYIKYINKYLEIDE